MDLTAGLDDTNGRHVLDAVAHRLRWHERGTTHLVNGQQEQPTSAVDHLRTAASCDQGLEARHG